MSSESGGHWALTGREFGFADTSCHHSSRTHLQDFVPGPDPLLALQGDPPLVPRPGILSYRFTSTDLSPPKLPPLLPW